MIVAYHPLARGPDGAPAAGAQQPSTPKRPARPDGLNFDHLVYRPGGDIDALTLEQFSEQAWPILNGAAPTQRGPVPLVPLGGAGAALLGARLAAAGLEAVAVPKSLYDLLYYHALLTGLHEACEPMSHPSAKVIMVGRRSSLDTTECSHSWSTASPETYAERAALQWLTLAALGLDTASPALVLPHYAQTPDALDAALEARLNDPRQIRAAWALNRAALHAVRTALGDVLTPLGHDALRQLSWWTLRQVHSLQDRLLEHPSTFGLNEVYRANTAYGPVFSPLPALGLEGACSYGVRDNLVMAAIEHEIAAPPHVFSLYRSARVAHDFGPARAREALSLSFGSSALMGMLFDGQNGCATGRDHATNGGATEFYALDVALDDADSRSCVYLPPVRNMLRIVEYGEYFHPRLRCERPAQNDPVTLRGISTLGPVPLAWHDHLFVGPGASTAREHLRTHHTVLYAYSSVRDTYRGWDPRPGAYRVAEAPQIAASPARKDGRSAGVRTEAPAPAAPMPVHSRAATARRGHGLCMLQ